MPSKAQLTELYTTIENRGGRVWSPDLIKGLSNNVVPKIYMLIQKLELQRVLDAREQGGEAKTKLDRMPRRTNEDIKRDIANLEKQLKDFQPGKPYDTIDILGNHHSRVIPQPSDKNPFLELRLLPYMYISQSLGTSNHVYLWEINTRNESQHKLLGLCPVEDNSWKFWKHRWQTGKDPENGDDIWRAVPGLDERNQKNFAFTKFDQLDKPAQKEETKWTAQWAKTRTELTDLIKNHADKLINVDRIVCFALGSLHYRSAKSFVQHLAAATIRDTLIGVQKARGTNRTIEVIAQDPAYDENCKQILREELGIHAVTNFDGFLSITKDTFVISIAPSAPIVEVVADITLEYGGPAAILCDAIDDDYLAPETNPEESYGSEWATRNAVAFKRLCVSEEFGDAQDILKLTEALHQKTWSNSPAKMPKGSKKDKCQEEWAKAMRVNFPDLVIYFRN